MTQIITFKHLVSSVALAILFSTPVAQAAPGQSNQSGSVREQVVLQVSDDDAKKWNLALNNAKNIQQELGANNVDIEIVIYGPGIGMLKFDSTVANRIDEAINAGVKIVACENTMKAQKLSKADMMTTIGYVPAGVIELIRKQKEGYAYIRP